MLSAFVIVAVLSVCATAFAGHQILPPQSTFNNPAALVLVGGAQAPSQTYTALALELQAAATLKEIDLWIANAHSPIDLPVFGLEKIIVGALNSLLNQGLPKGASLFLAGTPKLLASTVLPDFDIGETPFLAGHSLGGTKIQDYINASLAISKTPKFSFKGLVLLCAPLQRKYRADKNGTFPQIPVLTLGGSDDGLMRITRMAEAFYHGVSQSPSAETKFSQKAVLDTPVIVLEGVNHWQFASGTGPRPYTVRKNDLTASSSTPDAHHRIAEIVTAFLSVHMPNSKKFKNVLEFYLGETSKLLTPFIRTLNLEAFMGFKPACSYLPDPKVDLRSDTRDCWVGSEWSERAQRYMAGIDEEPLMHLLGEKDGRAGVILEDEVHKVWISRPLHLPQISDKPFHAYSTAQSTAELYLSTVSQPVYHPFDKLDTGLFPVAATEIRAKMSARQRVYEFMLNSMQDFHSLDTQMRCAEINSIAIEHARAVIKEMGQVGARVLDRFAGYGTELVPVADDGSKYIGPQWIWSPLKFSNVERDGKRIVEVRSPMMKTSTNFVIPFSKGFHYCKLLSPARVMEWIWIDSVRGH